MKSIRYTADVARDLKLHGNMAARVRKVMREYAETGAHSNNAIQLVGPNAWRMRIADFRVIFENGAIEIVVTKVAPRGAAYA